MKHSFICLLTFLLVFFAGPQPVVRALPKKVEVWFLSPARPTSSLPFNLEIFLSSLLQGPIMAPFKLVSNDQRHDYCERMGDHFFHPQYGLHSHMGTTSGVMTEPVDLDIENLEASDKSKSRAAEAKYLSNTDVDLVKCDSNYYFDLYCGKAKGGPQGSVPLEIWVDISSSFMVVDRENKGECYRKSFVKRVLNKCPENKVVVSVFDTSKKTMGGMDGLCIAHGLNDQNRIINWIKASNAGKLIMITDINEYTHTLSDFLDSIGATLRGELPQKGICASDLLRYVDETTSICGK